MVLIDLAPSFHSTDACRTRQRHFIVWEFSGCCTWIKDFSDNWLINHKSSFVLYRCWFNICDQIWEILKRETNSRHPLLSFFYKLVINSEWTLWPLHNYDEKTLEISSEVQSYSSRLAQMTENGISEIDVKKCTVTVLQTPRISIKYCITVKAKRDRAVRPDSRKQEKNQIYIYIYWCDSIRAAVLL